MGPVTGTQNQQPAAFCTECGSRLIPGARFCGNCGKPLWAPEPPAWEPAAPILPDPPLIAADVPVEPEPLIVPDVSVEPEPLIVPDVPAEPEPPLIVPDVPVEPEPPLIVPDVPVEPEPLIVPDVSVEPEPLIVPDVSVEPEPPLVVADIPVEPEPVVDLAGFAPESPAADLSGFTVPLTETDGPKTMIFVPGRAAAPEAPVFVPETPAAAPEVPAYVPEAAAAAPAFVTEPFDAAQEAQAFAREAPSIVLPDAASIPLFVPDAPAAAPAAPVQQPVPPQADRKKSGRGVLRGIGTALLTVPLIAFTVLTLLLAVACRAGSDLALSSGVPSVISDLVGSLYPVIISGVLAALFLMFIVWVNIHRIRRAFLAVGISSLVLGVLCIVAGLMPANVLALPHILDASGLDSAARHLRDLALPASVGTLLLGAVALSVYFCIRAIKKDDE